MDYFTQDNTVDFTADEVQKMNEDLDSRLRDAIDTDIDTIKHFGEQIADNYKDYVYEKR